MNQEIPKTATPVTAQDLYDSLAGVWPSVIGNTPDPSSLLVLLAQSAFETGNWQSTYNYNLAGLKWTNGYDYFVSQTTEGTPPQPTTARFRAYQSLGDGAADWLSLLHKRFNSAWPYVLAGDPTNFVRAIKQQGYFTGPEDVYEQNVVYLFNKFQKQFRGNLPPVPTPTSSLLAKGFLMLSGGLAIGMIAHALTMPAPRQRSRRYA